ncbi:hypothetical protein [Cohnella caldifontis]|uniref:hypothetical protein n=1 Tax=Cohnella caldifontis TaxID=3027471 RepID=UPI0023ED043B|nr:hypothetical protein [Cohnella sp. YIM B05605]
MKQALFVGLDGKPNFNRGVSHVEGDAPDISEAYELDPENPEKLVKVGYWVAKRLDGIFEPILNFETGEWEETLPLEEVEARRNPPHGPTELDIIGEQLVQRELESLDLRAENQMLGEQLVNLELQLLALEGGAGA